jgi:uncharacterized sodium:solute symporter family permease YidK
MHFLTAIRIILYCFCANFFLTSETFIGLLACVFCLFMAVLILILDFKAQVSYSKAQEDKDGNQ